jgi:CRISPR-associated protein Csm1
MAYGLHLMGQAVRREAAADELVRRRIAPPGDWHREAYEQAVGTRESSEEILSSIVAQVVLPDEDRPALSYLAGRPLRLDQETLLPRTLEEARKASDPGKLWADFEAELTALWNRHGSRDAVIFEGFYHLCRKYAWALPCVYGEPGVSLFQQWKMVAALAFAGGEDWREGPTGEFSLIGGDIPGIQDFVYTVTSKGAAKALRGRSFFIQLLGDAVVRSILDNLDLGPANVVYDAGGNFALLGPGYARVKEVVERVRQQVNAPLVKAIQGDTALVLEAIPVTTDDLFTPSLFRDVRKGVAERIARAKRQQLRELALTETGWRDLFQSEGKGSRLSCAVCRIEVDERNSKPLERTGEASEEGESRRICYLCDSFGQLARDVGHSELWMDIVKRPKLLGAEAQPTDGWPDLLARMTGMGYVFSGEEFPASGSMMAVNRLDFLDRGATGFRLVANVTPRTTADDTEYLRKEAGWEEDDIPEEDDIRSFTLLAHAAGTDQAIERVGVLRMDVDRLGEVFSEGVPDLTLPKLSALSEAIDIFFGGCLGELVPDRAKNDLYVIYAGGDDLFIVGAWHHLPDFAESIRSAFKAYTGGHPSLSVSAGITLEGARFPLYRAAERAGEAEARAKRHVRPDGGRKDAICFLDTLVGWEDWGLVSSQKDEILWLIGAKDNPEAAQRMPRALLQVLQSIHQLYRMGLRDARRRVRRENRRLPATRKLPLPKPQMFLGRWMWMQAYSVVRMARRSRDDEVSMRIMGLQEGLLMPATVRLSGLTARWAEHLSRKGE